MIRIRSGIEPPIRMDTYSFRFVRRHGLCAGQGLGKGGLLVRRGLAFVADDGDKIVANSLDKTFICGIL
jgi:hypothetical protein